LEETIIKADQPVKRLPVSILESWKRKASALDQALAFLEGRVDSEALAEVYRILKSAK
jgi:hypothetical protein